MSYERDYTGTAPVTEHNDKPDPAPHEEYEDVLPWWDVGCDDCGAAPGVPCDEEVEH